jgi:HK97 family phage portal protein
MLKAIQRLLRKSLGLASPAAWSVAEWSRLMAGGLKDGLTVEQLSRASSVVACSGLIADTLASCPLRVISHSPGGGIQQVNESDASSSLLTFDFDSRSAAVYGCCVLGNGWIYCDPTTGDLFALDSWRTSAFFGPDKNVWIREVGGELLAYQDIAHLKFRSQPRYVLGYSPLMMAQDSMLAMLGTLRMARAMSLNAAHPGVILSIPGNLSDKGLKNVKESWVESFGGDKAGSSPAVLEEGLTASTLDMPDALSMALVETLEFGAADVARLYNVPPSCIGLVKDSSRSTSVEESRQLVQRCLRPMQARIGDRLGRLLLTDQERAKGLEIAHDLAELTLGLGRERSEYLSRLTLAGIMQSNEARGSIGLEPDPDGGKLRFPVNTMPADQIGANDGGTPAAS